MWKISHFVSIFIKPPLANWKSKQYGAYCMYCKPKNNEIITSHCPTADVIQHFQTFVFKVSLDVCLLINLWMDGPNVNLSFQRKLISMLVENFETVIIDIGTCPFHKVNTDFGNAVAQIHKLIDEDQFAIGVHF